MNFKTAVKKITNKKNEKVRRKIWSKGNWVQIEDTKFLFCNTKENLEVLDYIFSTGDILADDWIIVSEKEELEVEPNENKEFKRFEYRLVEVADNES